MSIDANAAAKPLIKDRRTQQDPSSSDASEAQPLTRNEQLVYRELKLSDGPRKAYALLDALNDEGLRAPMTIYRALDGLIAKGLAKKITSLNAYAAIMPEARSAVIAYVTCRQCGKTREASVEKDEIIRLLAPTALTVGEVFIEAYGECQSAECDNVLRGGRD
jgi:Fur family zinc uptake transcriptional regulator